MTAIRDLAEAIDDPEQVGEIDALFLEKSRELSQVVPVAQISQFKDMDRRIASYERGEDSYEGINMGIPEFDFITSGIQPHEYVTISGFSGTGKSTLAQWIEYTLSLLDISPIFSVLITLLLWIPLALLVALKCGRRLLLLLDNSSRQREH